VQGGDAFAHLEAMNSVVGVIAIVLSIVAIVFAWIQHRDAHTTLSEMKQLAEQTTTGYVGMFPVNMKHIITMFQRAQKKIVVFTDFAGYGSYTDPDTYSNYQQGLLAAVGRSRDLRVTLFAYNAPLRNQILRTQFDHSKFDARVFLGGIDEKLDRYVARKKSRGIIISDYEGFIAQMLADETDYFRVFQTEERIDCFDLTEIVPIYLWMIDDNECIFSFENEPEKGTDFSFRTRDGRLIDYFESYLGKYANKSDPHRS
jgi:hypothetical protein